MQLHWCIKLFQNICFINFPAYSIVRCLSSAQIKRACFSVKCDKTWEAYACRMHRCNWSTYVIAFLLIFFCCVFFPYSSLFVFFHSILCFAFQIFTLFFFICVLYYLLFIIWIIFQGFCLVFWRNSLHSHARCVYQCHCDNFEPVSHFQINWESEEDSKGIEFP